MSLAQDRSLLPSPSYSEPFSSHRQAPACPCLALGLFSWGSTRLSHLGNAPAESPQLAASREPPRPHPMLLFLEGPPRRHMSTGVCLPQVTPGGSRMQVHMAQGLCWILQRDPTAALTPRDQGPHSPYPLGDKPWGHRGAVCGRGRGQNWDSHSPSSTFSRSSAFSSY